MRENFYNESEPGRLFNFESNRTIHFKLSSSRNMVMKTFYNQHDYGNYFEYDLIDCFTSIRTTAMTIDDSCKIKFITLFDYDNASDYRNNWFKK